jgi:hypothetical protein
METVNDPGHRITDSASPNAATSAGVPAGEARAAGDPNFDHDAFRVAMTPALVSPTPTSLITDVVTDVPQALEASAKADGAPPSFAPGGQPTTTSHMTDNLQSNGAPASTVSGPPQTVRTALTAATDLLTEAASVSSASDDVATLPTGVPAGAPAALPPLTAEQQREAARLLVQQRVAAANTAAEFAVGNERKVAYQNMNRFFARQHALGEEATIPHAVIKRWETTKKDQMWGLFKEYTADPSCASITVTEEHTKTAIKEEVNTNHVISWWAIKNKYQAHLNAENMKMATDERDTAISSYQHPKHPMPDNENWTMYEVPKEHTIAKVTNESHRKSIVAEGRVTGAEAVASLLAVATTSTIRDVSGAKAKATPKKGKPATGTTPPVPAIGAPIVKKVNLATEANQLKQKIQKFQLNILDLTRLAEGEYDTAVLVDSKQAKLSADALLLEYDAMALDRGADEPAKLSLQVKKNALLIRFKEAEKILSQRIASKKTAVPPTPPPI